MPIIALCGAIVESVLPRKVAGKKKSFFSLNSVRLLMGSSKEDEEFPSAISLAFLTHFGLSRAIKDYVMEAGPLGRPQRPRPAKRSGECDHDAVQVAVENKS